MNQINDKHTFNAVLNNLVGRNDVIRILKNDGSVFTGRVNRLDFGGIIFLGHLIKPCVQIYCTNDGLMKTIVVDDIKAIYLPE